MILRDFDMDMTWIVSHIHGSMQLDRCLCNILLISQQFMSTHAVYHLIFGDILKIIYIIEMLLSLPENPLVRPWGHTLPGAMSQLTAGEKMMEHFCCIFFMFICNTTAISKLQFLCQEALCLHCDWADWKMWCRENLKSSLSAVAIRFRVPIRCCIP